MMKVWTEFNQILTLEGAHKKDGRSLTPEDCSIIENGSVVFSGEKIEWIGPHTSLPEEFKGLDSKSFKGHVLTPGLVDCHTHIVFGGDRAKEYSMRLNGADYEAIGNAGGGILATMRGTNAANRKELFDIARERVERLFGYGIKTLEIKSGYGLNFDKEFEVSQVIDDLKKHFKGKVKILNTYMAAHAIPKEFDSSNAFIQKVVIPLLEKLAPMKIIDAVDIFHERGYFDQKDVEELFKKSGELGLPVKSHADEFQDNDGAALAVKYQALSTDHLLCTSEKGIKALAGSNTVATLLPGTGFFLGKPQAEARKFLDAGAKVAIGSDYNPGSCHWDNVLQVASVAAPQYKMNQCELWSAITLNASHALGLKDQGALFKGLQPSFSIFQVPSIDHITYHWGRNFNTLN